MPRVAATLLLVGVVACSKPGDRGAQAGQTAETHAMESTGAGEIPIEEVAKLPVPGTAVPTAVSFSPDDSIVTYLFSSEATLTRQLYAFDPDAGEHRVLVDAGELGATEANLSPEQKLRRERARERGLGVTRYAWAKKAMRMLVPLQGDLYVLDAPDTKLRRIVDTEGRPALDPQLSRDGEKVAYVQEDELYVVPFEGGAPRQLTKGARGTGKTHGLAEYIAQEEMGRRHGFWWSHDGRFLAYTEVDETHIPPYRIVHQGKHEVGEDAQEDHGYPFAGQPNAKVRLGVVPATGGRTVWMDLGMDDTDEDQELYLARVTWLPDGRLTAQVQDREQTRLDLISFDPRNGRRSTLLTERTDVWINLHRKFRPIEEGPHAGGFIWASERTGFMHLYLYDGDAKLVRALTDGAWVVDAIARVDEKGGKLYFTGNRESPTERHLYVVPLAGGDPQRLTQEAGMHSVDIDHTFQRFVDHHSSTTQPPTLKLRSLADGKLLREMHTTVDPRVAELGLLPPRLHTVKTRDGAVLHGAIYEPAAGVGSGPPHATIVSVYGGPHAQRVTNSWGLTADMRAQFLRGLGYLVYKLDNRGSARRGLAFEGALKHDMGNIEVQDQVHGVHGLVAQGLTDANRVGILGWSYGGYMSAMALARAPQTFNVAVAGAPVTHWDGYDTHYTERYMGTPQSNRDGYERSSVMHHIHAMEGKLLLVHGLIDENVHFRHTARLIDALIRERKDYELLLFPNERHSPRREADRVYMEQRIRDFLLENL